MPELPEVETIVRGLRSRITGQQIADLDVLQPSTLEFDNSLVTEVVAGYKIDSVWRRAKVMIWDLDSGYSLLFHLKMTGQIIYHGSDNFTGGHPTKSILESAELPDSSTRVIFNFSDRSKLYFNDQRKFGWIRLLPTAEVHSDSFLASVGPEHDDTDSFTPHYLWQKLRNRITPIKAVLLDQKVVAGIGNIYADEALHLAKVHPATKASSLSKQQVLDLFDAILEVLKRGIEHGGTSFNSYVKSDGEQGNYLLHARVFRKEGKPCLVCGTEIVKTRVAGRGTHYCPTCQVAPKGWKV